MTKEGKIKLSLRRGYRHEQPRSQGLSTSLSGEDPENWLADEQIFESFIGGRRMFCSYENKETRTTLNNDKE